MSIKSMMDAPFLTHRKNSAVQGERTLQQGGKPKPRSSDISKYAKLAYDSEFPELDMLEDFLIGFLTGSTFAGNPQCKGALTGMIYHGFEVVKNRQVYNPTKVMKAVIGAQKFQEQQSLFYS